ncbi:MAG: hypothetical protein HOO00_02140 [Rhodospirillaceae bacterium]|jgi:hypothetical protein|nr:hypothetical protein [Rhodospirillaceae bacterium]MBT5752380.1 hypothetical protein [Rhodospirillaceae bacterium]
MLSHPLFPLLLLIDGFGLCFFLKISYTSPSFPRICSLLLDIGFWPVSGVFAVFSPEQILSLKFFLRPAEKRFDLLPAGSYKPAPLLQRKTQSSSGRRPSVSVLLFGQVNMEGMRRRRRVAKYA